MLTRTRPPSVFPVPYYHLPLRARVPGGKPLTPAQLQGHVGGATSALPSSSHGTFPQLPDAPVHSDNLEPELRGSHTEQSRV